MGAAIRRGWIFGAMYAHRMNVLRLAFQRFAPDEDYETFVEQNRSWLEDYALFTALKDTLGGKPLAGLAGSPASAKG